MNCIILNDTAKLNRMAAEQIQTAVAQKPESVLGFATGSSPIGIYKELIKMNKAKEIDFSKVTTFNLDEYAGLDRSHPCSYYYFMAENLFDHINVDKTRVHLPYGMASDLGAECANYEKMIEDAGGIDFQVLGIGHNGHIGFNEPGTPIDSVTHVIELDHMTRQANSRFFSSIDEVPEKALSMGIKTIMNARKILLIALGEDKAEIIKKALTGRVTSEIPASILQLHPNITFFLDEKAASKL